MNRTNKIEFPEQILLSLRQNDEEFIRDIKRIAAVKYYQDRKLSIGQCAELAEMSEEEFIKVLSLSKISIYQYDSEEELLEDIKNA